MGVYLPNYTVSRASPCLKWLFASLSLRSPDFDPMPVPNGIRVVDLVALGPVFWLPPVIIIVSMIRSCILFVSVTLYSLSSR